VHRGFVRPGRCHHVQISARACWWTSNPTAELTGFLSGGAWVVYPFVTYGMIATQSGTAWPVAAASKPTTLSGPVMASAVGVLVLVGYFRRYASAATVRDLSRTSTGYLKSHSRADGVLSGRLCGALLLRHWSEGRTARLAGVLGDRRCAGDPQRRFKCLASFMPAGCTPTIPGYTAGHSQDSSWPILTGCLAVRSRHGFGGWRVGLGRDVPDHDQDMSWVAR
jgi:hypothetical protein